MQGKCKAALGDEGARVVILGIRSPIYSQGPTIGIQPGVYMSTRLILHIEGSASSSSKMVEEYLHLA